MRRRDVPPDVSRAMAPLDRAPAGSPEDGRARLLDAARRLGFTLAGIAPARLPEEELARLRAWLARSEHGTMGWLERDPEARADVARAFLPGARSVLVVGLPYAPERDPRPRGEGRARVSCYARGDDYHAVLAPRLEALAELARALFPGASVRRFTDTAPVLERAYGRAAGLGFYGKNGCLIEPRHGSYFFLGGLAIDRELPTDAPDVTGSCGTCTLCIDACPTAAIVAPHRIDARRCISYLTIEHRGAYDESLRPLISDHVFGCDICQAVCPWNEKFAPPGDPAFAARPALERPLLLELHARAVRSFKSIARGSAMARAGKTSFLRNIATAMGNDPRPTHSEALRALAEHEDAAVRDHARWALARVAPT
jgi:epoxyqueuosine reductase